MHTYTRRISAASFGVIAFCVSTSTLSPQEARRVIAGGENDKGAVIERAHSIHVLSPERLLIVEERSTPILRVVDASGRQRGSAGRIGSGPGEVRVVGAIAIDSMARRIVVYDPANRRFSAFAMNDALRYMDSWRVEMDVEQFCFLRGKLWISGESADGMALHEMIVKDGVATPVRGASPTALGHPLDRNPLMQFHLVRGPLYCDDEAGRVLAAVTHLGIVREVDAASGTHQLHRFPNFLGVAFTDNAGALTLARPKGGDPSQLVSFHRNSDGRIVATVATRDRSIRGSGFGNFSSFQAVSLDGKPIGPSESSQRISLWRNGVVCFQSREYPTLEIGSTCR